MNELSVLRLVGEIDLSNCETVMAEIDSVVAASAGHPVILDLSGTSWMDSVGLATLIHARNRTLAARLDLILQAVPASMKRVLNAAGMLNLFTYVDPHPVTPAAKNTLPRASTPAPIADPTFDRIAALARSLLAVPIALFTQVDQRHQVIPGASGLPPELDNRRSTPLGHSLCHYVVSRAAPLVVRDAAADPLFAQHPAHLEDGVQSYAGMPVTDFDGTVVGSLCAIDTAPHDWTEHELEHLRSLAEACTAELNRRRAVELLQAAITEVHAANAFHRDIYRRLVPVSLLLSQATTEPEPEHTERVQQASESIDAITAAFRAVALPSIS